MKPSSLCHSSYIQTDPFIWPTDIWFCSFSPFPANSSNVVYARTAAQDTNYLEKFNKWVLAAGFRVHET